MVFSLEHDIKVTKSHQNLLPTQSVIVVHTVLDSRKSCQNVCVWEPLKGLPLSKNLFVVNYLYLYKITE
jgi:hypothetical protein